MNSCAVLMNAHRANRFQLRATTFSLSAAFVTADCHGIVSHKPCDIALGFRRHITAAGLLWATAALASQGPGGGPGTAGVSPTGDGCCRPWSVGAGLIGAGKRPN
jgi:hypothetical protein